MIQFLEEQLGKLCHNFANTVMRVSLCPTATVLSNSVLLIDICLPVAISSSSLSLSKVFHQTANAKAFDSDSSSYCLRYYVRSHAQKPNLRSFRTFSVLSPLAAAAA